MNTICIWYILIYDSESFEFVTFVGRSCRNICNSEVTKRQTQFAQSQLGKQVQTLFTQECRFKSLFARVNRCVKDFWNSLFADIDGVKVNQSPNLRLEVPTNALSFGPEFKNSWGGKNGTGHVHGDLFLAFRDTVKDRFGPGVPTTYEPRDDNGTRLPLGGEFSYSFNFASFKRPRQPSATRVTPDGKCK